MAIDEEDLMGFIKSKSQMSEAVKQAKEGVSLTTRLDPQAVSNQVGLNNSPKTEVVNLPVKEEVQQQSVVAVSETPNPVKEVSNIQNPQVKETQTVEADTQEQNIKEEPSLDNLEENLTDKEINFKKLRSTVKEVTSELKTKETELEEAKNKLSLYEKGEIVPEAVKPILDRVQELEKYEQIHNLKASPAYKEAYVKPLTELNEKIKAIAKDYNIPEHIMQDALNIKNRASLNRFLSDHFDDVGAIEIKQLITKTQNIQDAAKKAENEPIKALQEIEEQHNNNLAMQRANDNKLIASTSKNAWIESLDEIKHEGKFLELIYDDNDKDHNEKLVKPIISKAAGEYARVVKVLADNGLKVLPKEVAKALARMTQYAHASAVAVATRVAAEKELQELQKNTTRVSPYVRPGTIGSGRGLSTVSVTAPKSTGTKDAATRVLESIGIKG